MSAQPLELSTDHARLNVPLIHQFLLTTYWASDRSLETVQKTINNSMCVGGYLDVEQVAFGRVVTDASTIAYLADIFVLPEWRGKGYGRAITQALVDYVDKCGVPVALLGTRHAGGLYEKFGFEHVAPGVTTLMRRVRRVS